MPVDRKAPEVLVIILNGVSMPLSEVKSKVPHLWATTHPSDSKATTVAAPQRVASLDVVARDLYVNAN